MANLRLLAALSWLVLATACQPTSDNVGPAKISAGGLNPALICGTPIADGFPSQAILLSQISAEGRWGSRDDYGTALQYTSDCEAGHATLLDNTAQVTILKRVRSNGREVGVQIGRPLAAGSAVRVHVRLVDGTTRDVTLRF